MSGRTGGVRDDASVFVASRAPIRAMLVFMIEMWLHYAGSAFQSSVMCFEVSEGYLTA